MSDRGGEPRTTPRVAIIARQGKFLVAEPFFGPGPRQAISRDKRFDVGDVHPHPPAVPVAERLGRDRVVEVLRGDRIDRECRELTQVTSGGRRLVAQLAVGRLTGEALDGRVEAALETTVEHQRRDHVTGDVGTTEAAQHPRSPRSATAP